MTSNLVLTDRTHSRVGRSVQVCGWFLGMVLAFAGCTKGKNPTPGQLTLEFHDMSDSDVTVVLANGTDRSVHIEGSRILWFAIHLGSADAQVACSSPETTLTEAALFGSAHGESKFLEVSPGERVKLIIPTTLPQRYKGGRCRLEVALKDRTKVGPLEFRP